MNRIVVALIAFTMTHAFAASNSPEVDRAETAFLESSEVSARLAELRAEGFKPVDFPRGILLRKEYGPSGRYSARALVIQELERIGAYYEATSLVASADIMNAGHVRLRMLDPLEAK